MDAGEYYAFSDEDFLCQRSRVVEIEGNASVVDVFLHILCLIALAVRGNSRDSGQWAEHNKARFLNYKTYNL